MREREAKEMNTMYEAKINSPLTTLTADISNTSTVITVEDISVFSPAPNIATIINELNTETIRYTGISGNTLTGVTRGFEGTARAWNANTQIARLYTAYDHNTTRTNLLELDARLLQVFDGTLQTNLNADMVDGYHFDQDLRKGKTPSFSQLTLTNSSNPPLVISSKARVENLNADMVDGYHASNTGVVDDANTVAVRNMWGNLHAMSFVSNAPAGTAPFTLTSTTVSTNLNADMLDGYHANEGVVGNTVALRSATGWLNALVLQSTVATGTPPLTVASKTAVANLNADMLDGLHASSFFRANGTTNMDNAILSDNTGNPSIWIRPNGSLYTMTLLNATGDSTDVLRIRNSADTRNAFSVNGKGEGEFFGGVTAPRFTSTQATGTAPFTVASQTLVTNLNADLLDGLHVGGGANEIVRRDSYSDIHTNKIVSSAPQGTAPFSTTSTTVNTNFNADMLDGLHASSFALTAHNHDDVYTNKGLRRDNYIRITVDGDADTYYPVLIDDGGASFAPVHIGISRGYGWGAPSTWNTPTHRGGLTLGILWTGDNYWGGNNAGLYQITMFSETYTTMVAGIQLATSGMVVWLRGGTTLYQIESDYGLRTGVTVHLDGFTDASKRTFEPRTDTSRVDNEIRRRYSVRNGEVYDTDTRVYSPVNKPTPSDIGAAPSVSPVFTGTAEFSNKTGTAPFTVSSTTKVDNLNSELHNSWRKFYTLDELRLNTSSTLQNILDAMPDLSEFILPITNNGPTYGLDTNDMGNLHIIRRGQIARDVNFYSVIGKNDRRGVCNTTGVFQRWEEVPTANGTLQANLNAQYLNGLSSDDLVRKTLTLASAVDLNTILDTGFYRIQATVRNGPTQINPEYSQMIVSRGLDTIAQMIFHYQTGAMVYRSGRGLTGTTVWSSWNLSAVNNGVLQNDLNADKHNGWKRYSSVESMGLTATATMQNVLDAMPEPSEAVLIVTTSNRLVLGLDSSNLGLIKIKKLMSGRVFGDYLDLTGTTKVAAVNSGGTFRGWKAIAIADGTLQSTLNAELLDGLHATNGATANTVMSRDSNADTRARQYVSTAGNGTPPLLVTSPTMVTNFNAEMVGGKRQTDFVNNSTAQTIDGIKTFTDNLIVGGNFPLILKGTNNDTVGSRNFRYDISTNMIRFQALDEELAWARELMTIIHDGSYIRFGNTYIFPSGTVAPEGVITAGVGSLYLRTNGGIATTLYVKTSGSGNTGWTAK